MFKEIVDEIKLPEGFHICLGTHPEGREFLQIYQNTICNRTGQPYKEGGRKWDLSKYMTESEVVFTVWKALVTFIEHETREQFTYKGHKIFDPHISVNSLIKACQELDVRASH